MVYWTKPQPCIRHCTRISLGVLENEWILATKSPVLLLLCERSVLPTWKSKQEHQDHNLLEEGGKHNDKKVSIFPVAFTLNSTRQ